ncbi:aladin-like isoform X2 [Acanthaster planci]|uniref:Aladin-like isoform X2 n=1 Tax=Acanthaster planci TaxID=133434 RepID=A0A8B7Z532_ACAPL|nr:aladin-like isoform X2 [Acanthaster planci]
MWRRMSWLAHKLVNVRVDQSTYMYELMDETTHTLTDVSDSPPPREGFMVLRELHEDLLTAQFKDADLSKQIAQGLTLPRVTLGVETLSSLATDEDAPSAFLPCDAHLPLWKKAWYLYKENGTCGLLNELTKRNTEAPSVMSTVACGCLAAIRWSSSLRGSFYPHMVLPNEKIVSQFSQTCSWEESAIRALAWHPHTNKCAVAWNDDVVRIFTANSDLVPTLKHRVQRCVACITWKPLSASDLAVACLACILIWHIDPSSLSIRPSASCAQILSQSGHGPITSLAWDPRGRILVSASPCDTAMRVWDVARETCVALRRNGGGGVSLLRWSADNTKLFAATPSKMFRVWETKTWSCEKWLDLLGHCQAACWSPDSNMLLFCTENKPIIYALGFKDIGVSRGAKTAVQCADMSKVMLQCRTEETSVGGLIQDMAWDPTGERLAVLFKPHDKDTDNLIVLFSTRLEPVLELIPSGFVRGEPGQIPELIAFKPNFRQGALLTVCWQSGEVSYIPLMFMPTQAIKDTANSTFKIPGANAPLSKELFSLS